MKYFLKLQFRKMILVYPNPLSKCIHYILIIFFFLRKYINNFIEAGADIISFHPEADDKTLEIIKNIKNKNCKAGIAIHPNIKVANVTKYLELIDLVVVMTVVPGAGGQKFMDSEVAKIIELKNIRDQQKLNFEIEIDGGVNKETSQICKNSGADVLVAGSYIFSDDKDNYKTLIDSLR